MFFSTSFLFQITALIIIVIIQIPQSRTISFDFQNINGNLPDIILGNTNSYFSTTGLQITPNEFGTNRSPRVSGRAIYDSPLHLWDRSSGELADFSTNFTFIIASMNDTTVCGDGLAFFLAENNSVITTGGAMGLPVDSETFNSTFNNATHPFVAVEFDTYSNEWDPIESDNSNVGDHVGININSLISVKFAPWVNNNTGGAENRVWVNYDAASQNLSIRLVGPFNGTQIETDLYYIVDLTQILPEWVIFGISAATGTRFQRNTVKSWGFTSSTLRVVEEQRNQGTKKNNAGLVARVSIGSSVLILALVLLGFCAWRKRKAKKKRENLGIDEFMDDEFELGSGPKKFKYEELARSTNNFAEEGKLGEGGFGGVYKGLLRDSNTYVAVKRVSSTSRQGIKEYASEVRIISRLRHRNLVQLLGWCHEKKELLLVYEFMENGSLDSHLFNNKSLLTWNTRFKIAQGIASAVLYLHEEWEQCVVHRDIKSSNVMLDTSFNAKLGDFGLARLVDHEKDGQTTHVAGTMGYMAPEYMETGKATKESDVFSFGVVALEIVSGRKPINFKAEESEIRMVEWIWNLYGSGNLIDAVDQKMEHDYDDQEIELLAVVGLWCAHPDWKLRPSIKQAIQVLNVEAPLPNLPSKMPIATYFAPPSSFSTLVYGDDSQVNSSSYSYHTNSTKLTASSASSASASLLNKDDPLKTITIYHDLENETIHL
jgi:serine/threonine protein kinase